MQRNVTGSVIDTSISLLVDSCEQVHFMNALESVRKVSLISLFLLTANAFEDGFTSKQL